MTNNKIILSIFLSSTLALAACKGLRELSEPGGETAWKTQTLPEYPQNWTGDPEKGYEYLVSGGYIGTGIPFSFLEKRLDGARDTVLNREGNSGLLSYPYTAFPAWNGVEVVAGNCLTCHASSLNGKIIIGLGNAGSDFRKSIKTEATLTNLLVRAKYKKGSPEYEAFDVFGRFYKAIAPNIKTQNPGVNPAFRLEEACTAFRDPADLGYRKKKNFTTIPYTLASDVPPLWNLDKKHAIYYNGMGRGDFAKLLMQASVLGIPDSVYARKVHQHFIDVVAWARQLEPPSYPGAIDPQLVAAGKPLFEEHCSGCHGAYGAGESYPNKLVSLDVVGADPYYARYFTTVSGLAGWYNESWFARSAPESRLEPKEGYVAPPLDGIWATAPYLHNGSVPTVEELLNSPSRPALWQRTDEYDYEKLGWKYAIPKKKKDAYDTRKPGYGNQGHTFGDGLTEEERKAVVEYLKTL